MKSIRSRFTTLIILAIIISVVVIGAISIHFIRKISDDLSDDMLILAEQKTGQAADSYLNSIEQCVDTVAYYASKKYTDNTDEDLEEYLRDVNIIFETEVNNTRGVISYYFRIAPEVSMTRTGFLYTRTGSRPFEATELTDITKYDQDDTEHVGWYYIPKEKGSAVWLEPYVNKNLGGVKMISYVAPIYSNGEFIGILGIDYDYDVLTRNLSYDGNRKEGYTFITNDADEIIYHPDLPAGTDVGEISEKMRSSELTDEKQIIHFTFEGERQRAAWGDLTNSMNLFVVLPERVINGNWQRLATMIIIIALSLLALFLIMSTIMVDRITDPLTHLTEAAIKLDEGDYDVELNYEGKDEVGVLTAAFRQLIGHLQAYISDLNDIAYKDALTHLKNKGAFDNYILKLDDRLRYSEGDEKPHFAICMFDCNSLKAVNDTYGHDKGDIYLKTACDLICEVFKHSPVFRLGGDEFVSVLQNDDYDNRLELCMEFDRLTVSISDAAKHAWERVDIASGIAVYDPERDTCVHEVFKRADKRMYEDKVRKKAGIIRELNEDMVRY